MRPDVHAAALRSAAKLVLGMASLAAVTTACSSEATEETGASNDAVMTKDNGNDKTDKTDTTVNLGEGSGHETSKACQQTLSSAFPGPDKYQFTAVAQPADVVACCDEELTNHGALSAHRWECCVAYDKDAKVDPGNDGKLDPWEAPTLERTHSWACTPWGPPVPPKMNRARKMSPRRREMNMFLAAQVA